MKKYLLIFPLIFLQSISYADGFPEYPMDIYGNTNITNGSLEVYASSTKIASIDIKNGIYGSTKAKDKHVLLNQFEGTLSFKINYNGITYDTKVTSNSCQMQFTSKACRYDLDIIKQEVKQEVKQTNATSGSVINKDTFKPALKASSTQTSKTEDERTSAYNFAYKYGITTQPSITKANMNGQLTRAAMAKMLAYYAVNVLGRKTNPSKYANFPDVPSAVDYQYDWGITLAYQLGIMGVNIDYFRPYDLVTRAEFATALSRMLYGTKDGNPYYETHFNKLKSEGILTATDPDMLEIRGYVMLMLMRSFNNK